VTRSVEIPDAAVKAAYDAYTSDFSVSIEDAIRAALVAARPYLMPSREEIERSLRERLINSNFNGDLPEPVRTQVNDQWIEILAGTVLALLNGES
jgi:hypothetical protein